MVVQSERITPIERRRDIRGAFCAATVIAAYARPQIFVFFPWSSRNLAPHALREPNRRHKLVG